MKSAKVAAVVSIPLLWSNVVLPSLRLSSRGRTAANAGFATMFAAAFGGRPRWGSAGGLRDGLACAAVVSAGYGAALTVPALRERLAVLADRSSDVDLLEWVAVHIPIGTVYSEELIFRATVGPVLDTAFGPRVGLPVGAVTFGLWHIHPARAAGDSVPVTVAVTTLGGLLFGCLARRGGSATAPALLHLALNVGGAVAPRLARRLSAGRSAGGYGCGCPSICSA